MTYSCDRILKALGDPTRRLVLERVVSEGGAVVEIARSLQVTRPAVSQHLRVLKAAGLVTDRREGTRRYYQANPAAIDAVRTYLDRFWDLAFTSFRQSVERHLRGSDGNALP